MGGNSLISKFRLSPASLGISAENAIVDRHLLAGYSLAAATRERDEKYQRKNWGDQNGQNEPADPAAASRIGRRADRDCEN